MKVQQMVLTVALTAAASPAVAQDTHQMTQTAGGSAEVAQCLQAQTVVTPALEAARARLETARQTNSPAAMRAAVDTLDAVLVDVRTRLEPCAQMSGGQTMANMPGHDMANMPSPATQNAATTPATPAAPNAAAAPAGQNMANMPGHNMANMPAPGAQKPAAPSRGAAPEAPKQAAPAGHNMANMPSPPSAAATKPATPAATQPDMVEDPVSKTQVDPRTALRVLYQGRMYYFRSDKERQEFMKNPAKYVSAK